MQFQEWIAVPGKSATIYSDTVAPKTQVSAQIYVTEGSIVARYGPGGGNATNSVQAGANVLVEGDTIAAVPQGGTPARGFAVLLGVSDDPNPAATFSKIQEWIANSGGSAAISSTPGVHLWGQTFVLEGVAKIRHGGGGNNSTDEIPQGANVLVRGDNLVAECVGPNRAHGVTILW